MSSPLRTIDPSEVDIVIPTIRDLDFLEEWREFFMPYHIIVVKDGEGPKPKIPPGLDADVYGRDDIERILGEDAWCISYKDSACRCFGWLISTRKYVYTIDDDCLRAPDSSGRPVNAIAVHLQNLQTPSHPNYFNTLYDPYQPGTDFVRGYPFSLRTGVPTVISHGLWLNIPDYDAPTQLVKPLERNERHVDCVLTIPKGTLFPMCGMNLAFDRKEIGMALYFGLMGEGYPIGRYDDMWAGWTAKVICDHLNLGVKTGRPYIWHNKASDPFKNLQKEHKGIFWQEIMVPFFQDIKFSEEAKTVKACMYELILAVEDKLGPVDPYFRTLAKGMATWSRLWETMCHNDEKAFDKGHSGMRPKGLNRFSSISFEP